MRMSAYNIATYPQRSPAIVIETNSLCIIKDLPSFCLPRYREAKSARLMPVRSQTQDVGQLTETAVEFSKDRLVATFVIPKARNFKIRIRIQKDSVRSTEIPSVSGALSRKVERVGPSSLSHFFTAAALRRPIAASARGLIAR
jgi:hypothetical protein